MATDSFSSHSKGLEAPADKAEAIAPNDGADLTNTTRGIYVGGAGNIVATVGGTDVTFTAVQAGTVLPIRATRIKATGTTATGLVGLS